MVLVDSADAKAIREAFTLPGVSGFTTNPTLVARAAAVDVVPLPDYIRMASDLCRLANQIDMKRCQHVMIQGVGAPEDILKQATIYAREISTGQGTRLWIKLAPDRESMSCCNMIKSLGCSTLVTAVFTGTQALLAVEAGADGVAVYLGRLQRQEKNWRERVDRISRILHRDGKMMLLASFPDRETVESALEYSRDITVPPDVLKDLLTSGPADDAMRVFNSKVALRDSAQQ